LKYKFKTKPYAHQVKALKKLLKNGGGGLFMEMGTGKTKVAIDYACAMHTAKGITRILVVCPKSVISVWHTEIPKHAGVELEWRIINYDRIWRTDTLTNLQQWEPQMVIYDEAHKCKNPTAKRSKAAYKISKQTPYRVVMTGTPISKNPLDLFGQFKILDDGIFGTNYTAFKRAYALWGGYGGYQILKYINLQDMRRRIKPLIFQVKKEECLDLPARTHEIIPVYLKESLDTYSQLSHESVVEIQGEDVEAPIVLTRLLRLSQITGGHLKGEDRWHEVGREKLAVLEGMLEDMLEQGRDKVVVFCRFLPELAAIKDLCKQVGYKPITFHGGVSQVKRERRLAVFSVGLAPHRTQRACAHA